MADRYLLFPLLVPAALILAGNDGFGFDPPGWLDAFMYSGYFWHYPEHLPLFDDNYKISRLPWILPGFVAHSLGGVVGGSLGLVYVTMALGAAALYLLVRDTLEDRTIAAAVAVAWACCTWANGIGGWNYHVLAAAAYYLMACWLAARAARHPSPGASAAMAGVFFAAAVHTHLFLVVFAPLVALLYWAVLPPAAERQLASGVRAALLAAMGGLAVTVALASVNRGTGGAWLFFMPQIEQALRLSESGNDRWWLADVGQWLPSASYLVIPLVFMIAGLAVPLRRRRHPGHRISSALVALAWGAFAIMCFFQFVRRQTTLDYNYMAFALYLHAFPCLAAALAGPGSSEPARRSFAVAVIATAAILGSLLLFLPSPLPAVMQTVSARIGLETFPRIVAPLVVGLAGVAIMLAVRPGARVVTFAVWFAVVNGWIAPNAAAYGIGTPGFRREMIVLFREADRLTTELDPTLVGIKYWLSSEQVATRYGIVPIDDVFDSFVATRTWLTNLFGRTSPGLPIEQLTESHLERAVCIGVLSSVESQLKLRDEMEGHFASLGRPLEQVAARRFEGRDLSFALTVLRPSAGAGVAAGAGDGGPLCARRPAP